MNVPGSAAGALESFEAVVPLLDHALETLAGPFDHGRAADGARPPATGTCARPRATADER